MIGDRKPFDSAVHERTDNRGKNALLEFLNRRFPKCTHIENPNEYGIDVISIKNNLVIHCWDVEVREKHWDYDGRFNRDPVNCFERKDHMWAKKESLYSRLPYEVCDDAKFTYVQLNKLCTWAMFIDSNDILNSPSVKWVNRYSKQYDIDEYVRQVPNGLIMQMKISPH